MSSIFKFATKIDPVAKFAAKNDPVLRNDPIVGKEVRKAVAPVTPAPVAQTVFDTTGEDETKRRRQAMYDVGTKTVLG